MPKPRQTIQKRYLDNALNSIEEFFTAEELYKTVVKKSSDISIATVYRFLKDKVIARELHSYICDKRTVYSIDSKSHCHYTCQICGNKQHIDINDIGSIKKNINGAICHFQVDVTGVCDKCRKK
jgi:Fe2+ or Zn2+ uptake regulation protein